MRLNVVLIILIGTILFLNSCSKEESEEIKPEYIFAPIIGVIDMDRNITIGDSVELVIYYRIEDQDYSFNKLICEKQGANSSYVEQFLFKVELLKEYEQREHEIDSVVWKYLPTDIGLYNIEFYNIENPLAYYFNIEYPTFEYKMESEDYQLIVDSVSNNPSLSQYVDIYGTTEFYFGASSYWKNFDLRISKRIDYGQTEFETMTEEDAMNLIWERLISSLEIVLKVKYSNANLNENFIIEFDTYANDYTTREYSAKFICNEIDNNINFEFIEFIESY